MHRSAAPLSCASGRRPLHFAVPAAARLTAFTSDLRHVLAVLTYCFPALLPGLAGLIRGELVGSARGMGSPATLARDLSLLSLIHRCEAATAGACHKLPLSTGS